MSPSRRDIPGGAGTATSRASSPARISTASMSSGTADSGLAASSRSSSRAPVPGSSSSNSTDAFPAQARSPGPSVACSSVTGCNLSAAGVPSARTTGSTSDTTPCLGSPSSRSSHSRR